MAYTNFTLPSGAALRVSFAAFAPSRFRFGMSLQSGKPNGLSIVKQRIASW